MDEFQRQLLEKLTSIDEKLPRPQKEQTLHLAYKKLARKLGHVR